jgi:hypothetical protein
VKGPAPAGVDSLSVGVHEHDDGAKPLLGGALLSDRLRSNQDGHAPPFERQEAEVRPSAADAVLGAATQIEIESGHVSFLVPFEGRWPTEYWWRAFRQAKASWPTHLSEPLADEGRGLQIGPLPAQELEDHVHALKDRVAAANRIYTDEIEPELRRQREDALRREEEERRFRAQIESKLKLLLG